MPTGQRLQVVHRDQAQARGGVASMTAPMGSGQLRTGGAPCATRRPARGGRRRARLLQRLRLRARPIDLAPPQRHDADALAMPPIVVDGSAVHQVARAFGHADPVDEALIDRRVAAGHMGPRHRGHASVRADDQVRLRRPPSAKCTTARPSGSLAMAVASRPNATGTPASRARRSSRHRLQVRAQDGASGISHQAIQRLDIKAAQRPALGVVAMHGGGRAAQRQHLVQQFQIRQHEAGIRPQRHARPHRGRRRAALVDPGFMSPARQRQGRGQPRHLRPESRYPCLPSPIQTRSCARAVMLDCATCDN